MAKYKVFDGKKYEWLCRYQARGDASKKAKLLRENYQLVRVVPEKLHGDLWFSVYTTRKVMRRIRGSRKSK